ncbi:GNAT family N-acetyltransferase [Alteribacter populi]|uniref:GNAT family N-acetyltransferase n=1 Tax=Alteribacter populi TaxID=2011011 RepID=UPI001FE00594|nr:GNAT family N-acetyltransferase [Alteribacter populi]
MKIEEIFNHLPTLETDRLTLRKFTIHDAQDMFAYSSDPDVSRYVPWEVHKTIDDSIGFLRYILKQYDEGKLAPWAIVLKARNDGGRYITC